MLIKGLIKWLNFKWDPRGLQPWRKITTKQNNCRHFIYIAFNLLLESSIFLHQKWFNCVYLAFCCLHDSHEPGRVYRKKYLQVFCPFASKANRVTAVCLLFSPEELPHRRSSAFASLLINPQLLSPKPAVFAHTCVCVWPFLHIVQTEETGSQWDVSTDLLTPLHW